MGAWLFKTERNPEWEVQMAVPGGPGERKEGGSELTSPEHVLLARCVPRAVHPSSPFRGTLKEVTLCRWTQRNREVK